MGGGIWDFIASPHNIQRASHVPVSKSNKGAKPSLPPTIQLRQKYKTDMKAKFCITILVTVSVFQEVHCQGGGGGGGGGKWDSFVGKANQGLDLIDKAAKTFNVQTDEELVDKQLDRGFKQWRQDAKISIKAGIPAALFEKILRRKMGQYDIPVDYWRALETEIQDSYYVPQNVWKESSFIFSHKCKKHFSGGRKERRERIRRFCRAVSRPRCKAFKKKMKMNAYHQKGCPVYSIGLYISRNVECGTMNYVLVQSKVWMKLAADIFVIKKTTSVMGFSSGKITFKKRKQAMKPEVVKFIVDMAERVSLETIIKSSSQLLQYDRRNNQCNPGLPYQGSAGGFGGGSAGGYGGGGPDVYTGTPKGFLSSCTSGHVRLANRRKAIEVHYPPERVAKAIHLIRNPFTNICIAFSIVKNV